MKQEEFTINVEKDLTIDEFNLIEECKTHSLNYFRYADAMQQAKAEVTRLSDELSLIVAEQSTTVREKFTDDKIKFTEALINSTVQKSVSVIDATAKLRKAQKVLARLQVAVTAMEARKSQLDNIVKLYCAGIYSEVKPSEELRNTVVEKRSAEIRKNLNKEF